MEKSVSAQAATPGEPSTEILAAQQELIDTFELFDDWTDRYQFIIDLGRQSEPFPDELKTEANRLHGCQSQVWIVSEEQEGLLFYSATSDASIVSGLIAMLLQVYSGRRPQEILSTPPDFIARLSLAEHLSPTRSNGLHAMIQRIRQIAVESFVDDTDV